MVYYSSHRHSSGPSPLMAMSLLAALATATMTAYYLRPDVVEFCKKKLLGITRNKEETAESSSANKSRQAQNSKRSAQPNNQSQSIELPPGAMIVKPIGAIKSIYRLCVGTPRQGLLAPNARGRIELTGNIDVVDGLDQFSHIWIVFVFHLNTTSASNNKGGKPKSVPSKIAPPALGGKKVGVLATRSPHRGNPIGMTLCQLDSIEVVKNKQKNKQNKKNGVAQPQPTVILHISGLDLVDGTPVLDIKPFVPHYDSVPEDKNNTGNPLQVPSWVSGGLATKRKVVISDGARSQLHQLLRAAPQALDFYGPHCGDESIEDTLNELLPCIQQVLAVDVRSAWQTKKARGGKSQADRAARVQNVMTKANSTTTLALASTDTATSPLCTQQLDNLLIYYSVDKPYETNRMTSEGSGAEDVVTVHSFELLATTSKGRRNQNSNGYKRKSASKSSARNDDGYVPSSPKESRPYSMSASQITQYEKPKYRPPPLEGGGYSVIQSYWNEVATVNTPRGLVPSATKKAVESRAAVPRELSRSLSQSSIASSLQSWSHASPPASPRKLYDSSNQSSPNRMQSPTNQRVRIRQELQDLVDEKPFLDAMDDMEINSDDDEALAPHEMVIFK